MTLEKSIAQIETDRFELAEANLIELAKMEMANPNLNHLRRTRDFLELADKVQWLRLHSGSISERQTSSAPQEPSTETKSVRIVDKAEPLATDLDSVAERILGAFKSEDDTRTDADLLVASGLKRDEYLDVRDLLLMDTEEISETAEGIPTEYVRNWPRKAELN